MIKYKKAIKLINKATLNIGNESISVLNSVNRICAENVKSFSKNPSFNNTAFDGFAVISNETRGLNFKNFKKFKILRTIAAGDNPKINNYKKKSTVEIMTGGLIPKPFDSIIPVEKVKYFPLFEKTGKESIVLSDVIFFKFLPLTSII